MTRLVPRPDWTPEDVAAAIWAVASSLSDQRYLQLNTPDRIEAFARLPAVLALFRPAEEPANGPAICVRCRAPIGDDLWFLRTSPTGRPDQAWCLKCAESTNAEGKRQPAPVAPPPAEEREEVVAICRYFNVDPTVPGVAYLAQCFGLRGETIAALRSELSASQREVERLRQQLDPPTQSGSFGATTAKVAGKCIQCNGDIYHDPHHIGEYLRVRPVRREQERGMSDNKSVCAHDWETGRWGVIIGVSRCRLCGVRSTSADFAPPSPPPAGGTAG